ncbi:MAG: hypothetical protein IPN39_13750 [Chitinophagaceae bacterium]|nr:hypothetical protein [Chitinophagaceae bacterium]
MKKHFLYSLMGVMLLSTFSQAQQADNDPNVIAKDGSLSKRVFKNQNPAEDKTELIDIIGTGSAAFSASNTADGSTASYKHSLKITLALSTPASVKGSYQLVFYTIYENIPYAAATEGGVVTVFYPISMYDGIKQKLDQSFAAKKKVQLKVIQKTNGYREGTLMF